MTVATVILLVAVVASCLAPNYVLVSCDFSGMSFPAAKTGAFPAFPSDFGGFASIGGFMEDGRDYELENMKKEGMDLNFLKSVAGQVDVLGLHDKKGTTTDDAKEDKDKTDGRTKRASERQDAPSTSDLHVQ